MKLFKPNSTKTLGEVDLFTLAVTSSVPTLLEKKGPTLNEDELVKAVKNVYSALKKASDSL